MRLFLLLSAILTLSAEPVRAQPSSVSINDYRLSVQELAQLGGAIPPGDYWYDPIGGFWGHMGGPTEGQVAPGYSIGRMRADASSGTTNTFINGRRLTAVEVMWLNQQVPVQPGYFWMNAQGVFGYVGGPALGQINLSGAVNGGNARPSLSERGMLFRPGEILGGQ
jgi:hypothetical protein